MRLPESHRCTAVLLLLAAAAGLALPALAQTDDPANDPRVQDVAGQLMCYCGCNTQSVADCACDVARKERGNILARLDAGASRDEVIAEWVELRGTGILIQPPAEGFNLLGWFLPGAVLLAAGLLLALQIRRWSAHRPPPAAAGPAAPSADPEVLERLQRDLDAMDR